VLILKGVSQFVCQYRLLLFNVDPIKHENSLGFGVVIGFDLLLEQRQQEGLEGEIAVEHAELFEHNLAPLKALGAFVFVELFFQVAFDSGAVGDLALYVALDRQTGLLRGKFDQFINQGKELASLFRSDVGRGLICAGDRWLGTGWRFLGD
jgi:hypothetical protein